MAEQTIDYDGLKRRGFLRQRQEGFFVVRTRMNRGIYKDIDIEKLAFIAKKYARGILHATTRQGLEIPFIKYEDIDRVESELLALGIQAGTSGPRLRTTTVCPGTNWCKSGLVDTFSLSEKIEEHLNIKCGMDLPHKFKISIAGCPNMCTRPNSSEIGIHGQVYSGDKGVQPGYVVYIGGNGGRTPREGFKVDRILGEKEVLALIERTVNFYKAKARSRQRLGLLIEEFGREKFINEVVKTA